MKRRRIEKCHLPCAYIVDLHRVVKYRVRESEQRGGEARRRRRESEHASTLICRAGYRIFKFAQDSS